MVCKDLEPVKTMQRHAPQKTHHHHAAHLSTFLKTASKSLATGRNQPRAQDAVAERETMVWGKEQKVWRRRDQTASFFKRG
jgi:hypothetical protein